MATLSVQIIALSVQNFFSPIDKCISPHTVTTTDIHICFIEISTVSIQSHVVPGDSALFENLNDLISGFFFSQIFAPLTHDSFDRSDSSWALSNKSVFSFSFIACTTSAARL